MGIIGDIFHRPLHGQRGHRGDVPIQPSNYAARKPQPPRASAELHGLFKAARDSGQDADPTLHGAIADALDDEFPGTPISDMIRRKFSQGTHAGTPGPYHHYYDHITNDWDGSFPYAARLGKHGPFSLFLRHEEQPRAMMAAMNPRWVIHAVSDLPGSKDFGYNFEIPHEEAHRIPQMFPAAAEYITAKAPVSPRGDWFDRVMGAFDENHHRQDVSRFHDRMAQEEDARTDFEPR